MSEPSGKVVLGSLKGNLHGLGKDMVAAALRSSGFQVVDLGVDVSPEAFVTTAIKEEAQVIAVSITLKDTVPYLRDIVDALMQKKLNGRAKIVIGGQATSEEIREKYGIDAYARDATDCVEKVRALLSRKLP